MYGIVVEGLKTSRKIKGMVMVEGDMAYPVNILRNDFEQIKQECHKYGLKFYSGENRLRTMGDSMCCCGIDGLAGFKGNSYNLCHIYNGDYPEPTKSMLMKDSAKVFTSILQNAGSYKWLSQYSFVEVMSKYVSEGKYKKSLSNNLSTKK